MTTPPSIRPRRGVAFVLVLWVVAMLTILLGSFSMVARTEQLQSHHLFDSTRARYAAEAGIDLAVFEMRQSDPTARWVADGRPYRFMFNDAQLEVSLIDDSGKIDINSANTDILTGLFMSHGATPDQAAALADAVQDFRDPDDLKRPNGAEIDDYKAAGLPYGPINGPFDTIGEIQQVLGMTYDLYQRIEPALTIYSGRAMPNLAFAPADVLEAFPGVTPDFAEQLVEQRHALSPTDIAAAGLTLPDGTAIVAGSGGLTYSVTSRAQLPNGAHTEIRATIRLGGNDVSGRPYTTLRWQDGEKS